MIHRERRKIPTIILTLLLCIFLMICTTYYDMMNYLFRADILLPDRAISTTRRLIESGTLPKVAVYSGNFGNYREELNHGIDNIPFDPYIDYYFFTDDIAKVSSDYWSIEKYERVPGDEVMNSDRWTSKHLKFYLPAKLKEYDIIVWYDSKVVNKPLSEMLTYEEIVKTAYEYKLNFVPHPDRNRTDQELLKTIEVEKENELSALSFLNEIKGIDFELPLIDTCFIIRVNDPLVNSLFERAYQNLKKKGLKRDQNIMSYTVHEMNFPTKDIHLSLRKPRPPPQTRSKKEILRRRRYKWSKITDITTLYNLDII